MSIIMDIITSEIFLGIIVSCILAGSVVLIKKHNGFRKTFDILHKLAAITEKNIPDDTKNKKLNILDKFLKMFVKKYKEENTDDSPESIEK